MNTSWTRVVTKLDTYMTLINVNTNL